MWWLGYGSWQPSQRNYLKRSEDLMRREFGEKAYKTLWDKLPQSFSSKTRRKESDKATAEPKTRKLKPQDAMGNNVINDSRMTSKRKKHDKILVWSMVFLGVHNAYGEDGGTADAHAWGEHTSLTGHHAARTSRAYRSRLQLEKCSTKHWKIKTVWPNIER